MTIVAAKPLLATWREDFTVVVVVTTIGTEDSRARSPDNLACRLRGRLHILAQICRLSWLSLAGGCAALRRPLNNVEGEVLSYTLQFAFCYRHLQIPGRNWNRAFQLARKDAAEDRTAGAYWARLKHTFIWIDSSQR